MGVPYTIAEKAVERARKLQLQSVYPEGRPTDWGVTSELIGEPE